MIRTKLDTQINIGMLESVTEMLYGKITGSFWDLDFQSLTIDGYYFYYDNGEEKVLDRFAYKMDAAEINSLESVITPQGANKVEREKNLFEQAFLIKMASLYSLQESDLEII